MRNRHILIVEDDADNRKILAYYVKKLASVTVAEAADGAAALELLERDGADLVLMDVNMPGMDGLEATRAIRARADALASVPILALTAGDSARERDACIGAGTSDFIAKPIVDPTGFRETVEGWLRSSQLSDTGADRISRSAPTIAEPR